MCIMIQVPTVIPGNLLHILWGELVRENINLLCDKEPVLQGTLLDLVLDPLRKDLLGMVDD